MSSPTITITFSGSGSGSITSDPKLSCTQTSCTGSFARGAQPKISAAPTFGSTFAGWSGHCSGAGVCGPLLDRDRIVGASFTQQTAVGYSASPCTEGAFVTLSPGTPRGSTPSARTPTRRRGCAVRRHR